MVNYTQIYFNIKNISNKDVMIFGSYRLRPGNRADLFEVMPDLSEARVIDALRAPSGELYVKSVLQKNIVIGDFRLASFDNVYIDALHIQASNLPERGKVLGFDGVGLAWMNSGGGTYFEAEAPLVREGDRLRLDRAGPRTSGYLSKEDWLMFSNITTGFRVWQYCDIPPDPGVICKITSFSNAEVPFNISSIVNGSAVIVNSATMLAPGRGLWKKLTGRPGVCVTQHMGDEVILDRAPEKTEQCRLYFLVCLPSGLEIPESYEGAPEYVRDTRAEYFDFIDLNSSKTEIIKGEKKFKSRVSFGSGQAVTGELEVSGRVSADSLMLRASPQANYSLTSSAMGHGSWQPNPIVSAGPPLNCYDGQMWVRASDYEVFVYDGVRGRWLGLAERSVSAWAPQLVSHTYLGNAGGSTSDILPSDAVLVGLTASSNKCGVWTAEIHVSNSIVHGAFVTVGDDGRGFRTDMNVVLKAGDQLQFFANGHMVDKPKIEAIFRKVS